MRRGLWWIEMNGQSAAAHRAEVEAWRRKRYAALRRPTGWLTLIGLDWLHAGENRLGTDPAADVALPSGPAIAGTVTVQDGVPIADATDDQLRHEGRPVRELTLATDADGEPTLLELGALRLCVIERGRRLAVRTWDPEAPARSRFDGIPHFPVHERWRLEARLEPGTAGRVKVPDVLGDVEEQAFPGTLAFDVNGVTQRLQALEGGDDGELWLIFADATNGVETYGGGRFLYTAPPEPDRGVIIDFNRAYNPPCAFSRFATCPLPWPVNRLGIRVEAGELVPPGTTDH
jgi:uncharacterized protein (DUF1684 family)